MSNLTNQPFVRLSGGDRLITTSLAIANHFNKKHLHILRDIKRLDCSPQFRQSNFGLSYYSNSQNKQQPMYEITRDGFMFLVMGFTGRQAAIWKERYITAFNQLEQEAFEKRALEIPAFVKKALLDANPVWNKILRYKQKGLKNNEIAKLLDYKSPSVISNNLRKMEALSLIAPPKNLLAMQKKARAITKNRIAAQEVKNANS